MLQYFWSLLTTFCLPRLKAEDIDTDELELAHVGGSRGTNLNSGNVGH